MYGWTSNSSPVADANPASVILRVAPDLSQLAARRTPPAPNFLGLLPAVRRAAFELLRSRRRGCVICGCGGFCASPAFEDLRCVPPRGSWGAGAMAMGRTLVVCMAMLAVLVLRTEATYGSSGGGSFGVEFATRGLAAEMEDLRMSMYPAGEEEDVEDQFVDEPTRRMLAVARRSYISYGALNGNRSPCPARSGRSYYTPYCNSRSGPVQPYRRGCYQITRCARG